MKKLIFLIILICLVSKTYSQSVFQKRYNALLNENLAFSVQTVPSGGYIVSGLCTAGPNDNNILLIRLDIYGDTLWTRNYSGTGMDQSYFVNNTLDGGFILTAYSDDALSFNNLVFLKTDSTGLLQWIQHYDIAILGKAFRIYPTADGGYIGCGIDNFFGNSCTILIKTDSLGNVLWSKHYGDTNFNLTAFSFDPTSDGGYIITGDGGLAGTSDVFLLKTDSVGNVLWSKTYGSIDFDRGFSVKQVTDGGYVVAAYTMGFGVNGKAAYIMRTDTAGNLLWNLTIEKVANSSVDNFDITLDPLGGFVFLGYTYKLIYLAKIDDTGIINWAKWIGSTIGSSKARAITATADSGFVVAGNTTSFGAALGDIYIIKTDNQGNSGCNDTVPEPVVTNPIATVNNFITPVNVVTVTGSTYFLQVGSGAIVNAICPLTGFKNELSTINDIAVFPTLFDSKLKINTVGITGQFLEFRLYDINGRIIYFNSLANSLTINTTKFSNGIYYYRISDNNDSILKAGKLIKL